MAENVSCDFGARNVTITLRVTADQPIVAATNTVWSGFNVVPCTLLPNWLEALSSGAAAMRDLRRQDRE